jgi:hypothetical protein
MQLAVPGLSELPRKFCRSSGDLAASVCLEWKISRDAESLSDCAFALLVYSRELSSQGTIWSTDKYNLPGLAAKYNAVAANKYNFGVATESHRAKRLNWVLNYIAPGTRSLSSYPIQFLRNNADVYDQKSNLPGSPCDNVCPPLLFRQCANSEQECAFEPINDTVSQYRHSLVYFRLYALRNNVDPMPAGSMSLKAWTNMLDVASLARTETVFRVVTPFKRPAPRLPPQLNRDRRRARSLSQSESAPALRRAVLITRHQESQRTAAWRQEWLQRHHSEPVLRCTTSISLGPPQNWVLEDDSEPSSLCDPKETAADSNLDSATTEEIFDCDVDAEADWLDVPQTFQTAATLAHKYELVPRVPWQDNTLWDLELDLDTDLDTDLDLDSETEYTAASTYTES